MPWSIFALLLLAAFMHALWNALLKSGDDSLATMTMLCAVASLASIISLLFFLPLPARASWHFLALSVLMHFGYKLCLLEAYRHGELGQVYPIARGGAPIIVLFMTLLLNPSLQGLNEKLTYQQIIAVLVIACSVISLAFIGRGDKKIKSKKINPDKIKPNKINLPALGFACATACFIAAYSILDGLGARAAHNPLSFVTAIMALDFFPIAIFFACSQRKQTTKSIVQRLTRTWRYAIVAGLMSLLAYAIVVYAMTRVAIAPVVALRETSIIFAAIIGWLFLRERGGLARLLPAVLIVLAVMLLKF